MEELLKAVKTLKAELLEAAQRHLNRKERWGKREAEHALRLAYECEIAEIVILGLRDGTPAKEILEELSLI